jgi:hypothetical protein
MSESSYTDHHEPAPGATVESAEVDDSATADREAAYDGPASAGTVTDDTAVVADSDPDTAPEDTTHGANGDTSYDADVAAGSDEENPGTI